jgi:hypothetical protein
LHSVFRPRTAHLVVTPSIRNATVADAIASCRLNPALRGQLEQRGAQFRPEGHSALVISHKVVFGDEQLLAKERCANPKL